MLHSLSPGTSHHMWETNLPDPLSRAEVWQLPSGRASKVC